MARDAATAAIREQLMTALSRRAADATGETRRVFDERLATLRAGHTVSGPAPDAPVAGGSTPGADAPQGLTSLLASLRDANDGVTSAYPALPVLDEFRRVWTRVRSDSQMRQAVAHQPENAGPLNSSALVQRSITVMRELSPGYLQQFLSYIDDLAWLERMPANASGGPGPSGEALLPATIGKRPRKPRAKRG